MPTAPTLSARRCDYGGTCRLLETAVETSSSVTIGPRPARLAPLVELAALAVLTPVFWFPLRVPLVTLVALPVLPAIWLWRARGTAQPTTGLQAPLIYVLFAASLSMLPVIDVQLALPKLLGIALGAGLLMAIVRAVSTPRRLLQAGYATAVGLLVLAVVGTFAVDAPSGKGTLLTSIIERAPRPLVGSVPELPRGGLNPNELAGALVLLLPFVACFAASTVRHGRPFERVLSAVAIMAGMLVLVLTQSRGALAGGAVACALIVFAIGARASRAARPGAVYLVGAAGALVLVGAVVQMVRTSGSAGETGLASLSVRFELWGQALVMLGDFAWTGVGPGQIDPVLHHLYAPAFLDPQLFVPHAHNFVLDLAVELGLPGAAAFGCLLAECWRQSVRAIRRGDELVRWAGLGAALGLLAFMVFGLTDTIAPGARGGLALWAVMGLSAATGQLASGRSAR